MNVEATIEFLLAEAVKLDALQQKTHEELNRAIRTEFAPTVSSLPASGEPMPPWAASRSSNVKPTPQYSPWRKRSRAKLLSSVRPTLP